MILVSYVKDLNVNGNPQIFKDPNSNTFTIAVGCTVNIVYDISDEYTDLGTLVSIVFSPALPTGLTASLNETNGHLTISGTATTADVLDNHTITINQNDGGPVSTVITDTLDLEVVQANFTASQDSCTYCLSLNPTVDVSGIDNAPISDRGVMTYYQNPLTSDTDVLLTSQGYDTNVQFCFCGAGDVTIYPVLTIREIPRCGGTSPIVFESIGEEQTFEVTEYKANLVLPVLETCCKPIDQEIVIEPLSITLGESGVSACESAEVLINVIDPTGTIVLTTPVSFQLGDTADTLTATFTPETVGEYTVQWVITNCCGEQTFEITVLVCSDVIVLETGCNQVTITNNRNTELTVAYKKLASSGTSMQNMVEADISNLSEITTIPAFSSVIINYPTDNLYAITIDSNDYYFLLDCNIKKCELSFLDKILCKGTDCCDVKTQRELMFDFMILRLLIDQFYGIAQEFKDYQNINVQDDLMGHYNSFAELEGRALKVKDLLAHINKICTDCGMSICSTCQGSATVVTTNVSTTDCGCN